MMAQPSANNPPNFSTSEENPPVGRDNQSESESATSYQHCAPKTNDHNWILRDGYATRSERLSTMKSSFGYPDVEYMPIYGKRAQMLLDRMRREAEMEAVADQATAPTVEKYLTTYDDTYCYPLDPTFEVKDPPRLREMYVKYPLYNNPASSYWQLQHARHVSERPDVLGRPSRVDFNSPFRRNATFSKPIDDITDGGPANR